jgi:thiamine-phosphate pyrophosphorylase
MPLDPQRSLYLCVGARDDMATFLPAVLRGGVDIVQLREKDGDHERRRAMAATMVPICHSFGVPFVMNDFPELAAEVGADGVHVGQDDVSVAHCREVLGDDAIVGLSTHAPDEFARGLTEPVSYLSAGPITETPTKPGRVGTGLDYAVQSQAATSMPVFVTGGVTDENIGRYVTAGLRHFVVVRYLTEAPDPEVAARRLALAYREALAMTVQPPE